MREYRSAAFECLHEDFKGFLEHGKITQAEMDEFEKSQNSVTQAHHQ
jgi:DNA-binding transcriptional regulator YiaG